MSSITLPATTRDYGENSTSTIEQQQRRLIQQLQNENHLLRLQLNHLQQQQQQQDHQTFSSQLHRDCSLSREVRKVDAACSPIKTCTNEDKFVSWPTTSKQNGNDVLIPITNASVTAAASSFPISSFPLGYSGLAQAGVAAAEASSAATTAVGQTQRQSNQRDIITSSFSNSASQPPSPSAPSPLSAGSGGEDEIEGEANAIRMRALQRRTEREKARRAAIDKTQKQKEGVDALFNGSTVGETQQEQDVKVSCPPLSPSPTPSNRSISTPLRYHSSDDVATGEDTRYLTGIASDSAATAAAAAAASSSQKSSPNSCRAMHGIQLNLKDHRDEGEGDSAEEHGKVQNQPCGKALHVAFSHEATTTQELKVCLVEPLGKGGVPSTTTSLPPGSPVGLPPRGPAYATLSVNTSSISRHHLPSAVSAPFPLTNELQNQHQNFLSASMSSLNAMGGINHLTTPLAGQSCMTVFDTTRTEADHLAEHSASRRELRRRRLHQTVGTGGVVEVSNPGAMISVTPASSAGMSAPLIDFDASLISERGGDALASTYSVIDVDMGKIPTTTSLALSALSTAPPVSVGRRSKPRTGAAATLMMASDMGGCASASASHRRHHGAMTSLSKSATTGRSFNKEDGIGNIGAASTATIPFNPNQIGVEINGKMKNQAWVLSQAVGKALLYMTKGFEGIAAAPHSRYGYPHQQCDNISEFNQHITRMTSANVGTNDEGEEVKCEAGVQSSSSSCSSAASSRSVSPISTAQLPLQRTATVVWGEARVKEEDECSSGGDSNNSNSSSSGHVTTAAFSPVLLYKDINPSALNHAVGEVTHLHACCIGNEVQLTPGRHAPRNPMRAFVDENTDYNLRAAFASTEEVQSGGAGAHHPSRSSPSPPHYGASTTTLPAGTHRDDEILIYIHAPVIFAQLREFLGLDVGQFRDALCRSQWRQSVSPGKSGTKLFYFGDYVMKSVKGSEFESFTEKYLPAYVPYAERNPHSLLPQFYALITVRWLKLGTTTRYVLMRNVFATRYYIHRIYDVKGSSVGRTALEAGKEAPRTAFGALLLKDNDLPPQLIICGSYQRAILLAQFRSDVAFLHSLNIVDYSCMIGVRSRVYSREEGPSSTILLQRRGNKRGSKGSVEQCNALQELSGGTIGVGIGAFDQMDCNGDATVCLHGCDGGLLSLPIYTPGDDTTAREDVYYLGIIDVLQEYTAAKRMESIAKGFVNERAQISVVPPKDYAERLYASLERISV